MLNFDELKCKTIGVVYIFEGEDAPGFEHYHVWQSDIISKWLMAIQELKCRPLILDVRTFVDKAISGTLPHIDYVLNLNCGSCELSPMALVPSICSFFHIPCIPCDAMTILTGENKLISNLVAKATGIPVPQNLNHNISDGIFRPLNLGSSIGVKREPTKQVKGLYQEFIKGYDITTPIVYNPLTKQMDFMPTVLYIADKDDVNWYLGEENKDTRSGFTRKAINSLSEELREKYLELVQNLSINTFCRIDARIKCNSSADLQLLLEKPLLLEDVYFIEINPMPTVWINNAFSHSFSEITEEYSFYTYIKELQTIVPQSTLHNFLLSIAMFALSTTM
ncbi:MAG: hypothetical protein NC318_06320 [Blautia sp.]|nr:hypothetical protein [Lachnoclostridium sp.]MCM1211199.1 hypothetical protein [Blautia sp.]